jgi:hypothetical protein
MRPPLRCAPRWRDVTQVTVAARVVAGVLAAALLWAGAAKAVSRDATADAFGSLGLRWPGPLSVLVPAAEAGCAVALIVVPVGGATAALFLLVAFTAVLVSVIRRGVPVGCACFGAVSADPDRPVAWGSVARNAGLIALALFVVAVGPGLI